MSYTPGATMYFASIQVWSNGKIYRVRHSGFFINRVVCSRVAERVIRIMRRDMESKGLWPSFELEIY